MFFFFFQEEEGIRVLVRSRGLGVVYKGRCGWGWGFSVFLFPLFVSVVLVLRVVVLAVSLRPFLQLPRLGGGGALFFTIPFYKNSPFLVLPLIPF